MRKKKLLLAITIPVSLAVFIFVFFLIYMYFFLSVETENGKYRTNRELSDFFYENENILNELNNELLFYSRNGLYRIGIDPDWHSPDDLAAAGIDSKHLKELRRRLISIDIADGISSRKERIRYHMHASGLFVSGGSEGFLYSVSEPSNYFKYSNMIQKHPFNTIDDIELPDKGSYTIYIKLKNNWYIYNDYED